MRWRDRLGMAAVLLGTATVALDSAVNADFPRIVAHFHLPIPDIQWLVVSYTLASASLLLVFGRLGDIVGHRRVFAAGAAWSIAAFLICAFAPGFRWLLVGRVLQGIGAGLILSCGPALAASFYSAPLRAKGLAAYTAGFGWAGVLGPVVGGALLANFDWSCVFWARAPLAGVALLLAGCLRRSPSPTERGLRDFDRAGAALLAATLASFVLAVGTVRSPAVAAGACACASLAAMLFIRQERRASAPVIQLALFDQPGFALLNVGSVLVNLASFAVLLLAPFALAAMPSLAPPAQGLLLAAAPAGVAVAAPLAGRIAVRKGRGPLEVGAALVVSGLLTAGWAPLSPVVLTFGMLLTGLGSGLFQVAYLERTAAAVPIGDRGVAGSLAMLTRTLGIVLGAALLMQAFQAWRGALEPATLGPAFRVTFACAASLPAALLVLWFFRLPGRARNT